MELKIEGLELRDYFAIQILNGLISSGDFGYQFHAYDYNENEKKAINYAYEMADLMIKERGKVQAKKTQPDTIVSVKWENGVALDINDIYNYKKQ